MSPDSKSATRRKAIWVPTTISTSRRPSQFVGCWRKHCHDVAMVFSRPCLAARRPGDMAKFPSREEGPTKAAKNVPYSGPLVLLSESARHKLEESRHYTELEAFIKCSSNQLNILAALRLLCCKRITQISQVN